MQILSKMAVDYNSSTKFRQDCNVHFDYLSNLEMQIIITNHSHWYYCSTMFVKSYLKKEKMHNVNIILLSTWSVLNPILTSNWLRFTTTYDSIITKKL